MDTKKRKTLGAYYTPDPVVQSLVAWATRSQNVRMLDPSCGDGRFLIAHPNSVGVEQDVDVAHTVHEKAPGSLIHQGDFFAWAEETHERFDCAAGNPPFIRYQRFTGETRNAAQALCAKHGTEFSALASSWAPFIVATSTLLKPGGRMAFVVPAEIGHAPYATPVIRHMTANFDLVQVIAVREKLFPELSEDCWLLYADGYSGATDHIVFSSVEKFGFIAEPPTDPYNTRVRIDDWTAWNQRLRPFLLPAHVRELYARLSQSQESIRFGAIAKIGVGYVTGANSFFHLKPSEAQRRRIPQRFLVPSVRNSRCLTHGEITNETVDKWRRQDDPILLLRIGKDDDLPKSVGSYLGTKEGREASTRYKCRNRAPWYAVPDVTVPHAFLSYMSGSGPHLVMNKAECVGTNSVHVVRLKNGISTERLLQSWQSPLTKLSCEIEGHPLGGGLLKLEPREASRVVLSRHPPLSTQDHHTILAGVEELKRWRHYGK